MKAKTKKRKAVFILVTILSLAAVFAAAWYSNGFESFKPLYLTSGQTKLSGSIVLPEEGTTRIEIKSAGFEIASPKYEVKILPNVQEDFTYTVSGRECQFSDKTEITSAFDIKQYRGYIEITAAKNQYKLENILTSIHGAKATLTDPEKSQTCYFVLTVTANKKTVTLPFRFYVGVTAILIDTDGIIFGT